MAEVAEAQSSQDTVPKEADQNTLNELKKELEGWREVLIRLQRVLIWEKPYHPAILVGITTLLFASIYYLNPSVLTTFALMGLVLSLVDFLVPILGPRLMKEEDWSGVHEKKYEEICEQVMHTHDQFLSFKRAMSGLKADKPKMYFAVVMGCLLIFAWLGSLINNLFLTYFVVTLLFLLPGLRHHGLIQKYFRGVWFILKRLIFGKPKKEKEPKKTD